MEKDSTRYEVAQLSSNVTQVQGKAAALDAEDSISPGKCNSILKQNLTYCSECAHVRNKLRQYISMIHIWTQKGLFINTRFKQFVQNTIFLEQEARFSVKGYMQPSDEIGVGPDQSLFDSQEKEAARQRQVNKNFKCRVLLRYQLIKEESN